MGWRRPRTRGGTIVIVEQHVEEDPEAKDSLDIASGRVDAIVERDEQRKGEERHTPDRQRGG